MSVPVSGQTKQNLEKQAQVFLLFYVQVRSKTVLQFFSVLRTNKQNISTLRLKIAPYPLSTDVSPRPYLMKWVVGLAHQYDLFSSLIKV